MKCGRIAFLERLVGISGSVSRRKDLKSKSAHVAQGACHLLPSDVRIIRNWVHANNDLFGLEVYTLLLMSIELFLRKMECSSLQGENFNVGLFLLTDQCVPEALNVSVKGKNQQEREERQG